jgi:glycosyltransferase involved in cell wall biosynthesis
MPFISILTIVYNVEDLILRCYNNILDQSFQNWEWVIVNDGSSDNTLAIITSIYDPRIKIITYEQNQGRGYARNKGLESCLGTWIAIFDVDDIHFPDKLAIIHEKSLDNIDFFCSYAVLINNSLEIKGYRGFSDANGIFPKGFIHPTMACKAGVIKKVKYSINPGTGGPGEDARVLWILSLLYRGHWHDDALTVYQEEREINVKKTFWSNFGHLKTIIQLWMQGYFKINISFIKTCIQYVFKLIILSILFIFPSIYKYSVRYRANGILLKGWKLSESKLQYLKKIQDYY